MKRFNKKAVIAVVSLVALSSLSLLALSARKNVFQDNYKSQAEEQVVETKTIEEWEEKAISLGYQKTNDLGVPEVRFVHKMYVNLQEKALITKQWAGYGYVSEEDIKELSESDLQEKLANTSVIKYLTWYLSEKTGKEVSENELISIVDKGIEKIANNECQDFGEADPNSMNLEKEGRFVVNGKTTCMNQFFFEGQEMIIGYTSPDPENPDALRKTGHWFVCIGGRRD